jgi:hypothetical protein
MPADTTPERDDQPVAPLGVKIIVIILLICGLGLAALPITVYLFGGPDEGAGIDDTATAPTPLTATAAARVAATEATSSPTPPAAALENPSPAAGSDAAVPPAIGVARGPFALPTGWDEKWSPWFENIDWVIGPEAGMAAARESGKPMLLFYTATW